MKYIIYILFAAQPAMAFDYKECMLTFLENNIVSAASSSASSYISSTGRCSALGKSALEERKGQLAHTILLGSDYLISGTLAVL